MNRKVQILMSTYNGEQYLREQIDSLLQQAYPEIEILVRDDGSKDSTPDILRDYARRYDNIRIFLEDNVGVTKSFFELLKRSEADYVAFCDQDDIWLEQKVVQAVEKLQTIKTPALYCSNKILVDAHGKVIAENDKKKLTPGFGNAVIESVCTGCTMVLNRELAENIKAHIPERAILHDWWCYLVASYVGQVVFDEKSYILYRQHEHNVVGQKKGFWGDVRAKARYVSHNRGKLKAQLMEFQRLYRQQDEKDKLVDLLLDSGHLKGRLKAVFCRKYYRQSLLDQFIVKGLLLINCML